MGASIEAHRVADEPGGVSLVPAGLLVTPFLSWGLLALTVLSAILYATWIYRRRELAVSRKGLLAVVRSAALALVLLLIWNPEVPDTDGAAGGAAAWVLLDASLSMSVQSRDGETPWSRARRRAMGLHGRGSRVLLFGRDVRATEADSLATARPSEPGSRLAPALERAAESGARTVIVLSDLRFQDRAAVEGAAERLGISATFESFGVGVRNAGIASFDLPEAVDSGDTIHVEVAIFGEAGGPEDSVTVEVRDGDDRLVGSRRVALPAPGRVARTSLSLPAPGTSGISWYRAVAILSGDAFPDDDERFGAVSVDPQEGGLLLVSLRPDWEPRFLLPVLEGVTGLPGRGYLAVAGSRFIPLRSGPDREAEADAAELGRRISGADLVVVHGVGPDLPGWLLQSLGRARRLLAFPWDRGGAAVVGAATGNALPGEWYVAPAVPASPMAADIAGLDLADLPPLSRVLPLTRTEGAVVPLRLQHRGSGPGEGALVLVDEGAGRRAVVLASGFWRWAFRDGAPRTAYRRFWSGVAGWLIGDEPLAKGPGVRPEAPVVGRDGPISWLAPGFEERQLQVELRPAEGPATAVHARVGSGGSFVTPALAPGAWEYSVTDSDGIEVGAGAFRVEAFTDELETPPMTPPDFSAGHARNAELDGRRRPLRVHPAPYLLLIALLCGEWIGRRRRGLR